MASDRPRALFVAALATLWVAGACSPEANHDHTSGARTLDASCGEASFCPTTGAVAQVEGITQDTIAYDLVGTGRLVVPLLASDTYNGKIATSSVAVLVRGRGPLSIRHVAALDEHATTANHFAGDSYDWKQAAASGNAKWLIIDGVDDTTNVTIADIRVDVRDDEISCSVAAPGRRWRR